MGTTTYGVAVGLVKDRGIYLSRRIDTPLFPKKWQFVNGAMKQGENGHTASIRIAQDQTGLIIAGSKLHYIGSITIDAADEFYFVYLVHLKEHEVPTNNNGVTDRSDWKLFKMNAAVVLDLVPGLRHILFKLNKALLKVDLEISLKKTEHDDEYDYI